MPIKHTLAGIASLAFLASLANAGILTVSGDGEIIAAPTFAKDAVAVSTTDSSSGKYLQNGFNEVQNYTLLADLAVDGGIILKGTTVNSHMIFLNTPEPPDSVFAAATAKWTFGHTILGIMSDSGGTLEAASTSFLGNPGTTYEAPFSARGLEGGPYSGTENDWISYSGSILDLYMQVTEPGDWIRVVTAVPEPSMGIFLLTLGGLATLMIRRRR